MTPHTTEASGFIKIARDLSDARSEAGHQAEMMSGGESPLCRNRNGFSAEGSFSGSGLA
jgi:hypothetical protein